ncbi:MAG: HpcH/HpaI aldolase family protein [Anaerolineae bacterium]
MLRWNTVKEKMLAGKPSIGGLASLGSPLAAELLALAGSEYVLLDDQHGIWDPKSAMDAFRGIRLAGSVPMVRVGKNDFYLIGAMLDRGALGIIVPMVHTPSDAEAAAFAMRYPPRGGRSEGAYGCRMYGPEYRSTANDEVLLAVQIESGQAVENAEAIMQVNGVDACWIGPADLANSMGLDLSQPADQRRHEEAIRRVLAACQKAGKIPGIACSPANAQHYLDLGFLFVTAFADSWSVYDGAQETLTRLRAKL